MRTFITFFLLTTIVIGQEGIPANVGTGVLPPGLDGETDLNAIKRKRIEALQLAVEVLRNRYERGLISISFELAAQIELAMAKLDSTTVKQERLDHIETAVISALSVWQRIHELQKIGARGGEEDAEVQARAAVFRFREMWLTEKAAAPQSTAAAVSGVPRSTNIVPIYSVDELNSCPELNCTRPCCWITKTRNDYPIRCPRANQRGRQARLRTFP